MSEAFRHFAFLAVTVNNLFKYRYIYCYDSIFYVDIRGITANTNIDDVTRWCASTGHYVHVTPSKLEQPYLVAYSAPFAAELELDSAACETTRFLTTLPVTS